MREAAVLPETTPLAGDLAPAPGRDFRRRFCRNGAAVAGAAAVLAWILIAFLAPLLAPHDPAADDLRRRLLPPAWLPGGDWRFLLGCDQLGRDILSRILYGARVSILIGTLVICIATTVGIVAGLAAGYFGRKVDMLISRLVDILLAFPYLVFAMGLMAAMGPGFLNILLALTYKEWVIPCRVVRADVLAVKQLEYIEAARATGRSSLGILVREILPNVLSSVVVVSTLRVATVIIMESSLSFLGIGVQPPTPAWGSMVSDGRAFILDAWWVSTFPGLGIVTLVLGINLMGQGLRDALDPRLRDR